MKRKVRWHIQEFISRKQKQIRRRWSSKVENLRSIEKEMFYVYELEDGESLGDEEGRSVEYLTYF
jgi:hypothetical protein